MNLWQAAATIAAAEAVLTSTATARHDHQKGDRGSGNSGSSCGGQSGIAPRRQRARLSLGQMLREPSTSRRPGGGVDSTRR